MGYDNILLSPLSLINVQQASKSMEVVTKPVDTAQFLPQPPLQEQGRQDLTAIEDHQLPPHVRGPEDLRPPHDGAESTPPPEVEDYNHKGQLLLAPIPLQTSRNADCQVQFAQQQLLQQGNRHANGLVKGEQYWKIKI